jgi:nicotinamidase-related amidase
MERVLPVVAEIAAQHPRQTVFTRFRAPWVADNATGQWQNLYRKWPQVTQRECDPALFELMDPLRELAPPATMFDKSTYSAFATGELKTMLDRRRADALIVTGSETDVCVVATVMQAVDIGYRVIVVTNAICSSSDEGHDRLLAHFRERLGQQIETARSDEVLAAWSGRTRPS